MPENQIQYALGRHKNKKNSLKINLCLINLIHHYNIGLLAKHPDLESLWSYWFHSFSAHEEFFFWWRKNWIRSAHQYTTISRKKCKLLRIIWNLGKIICQYNIFGRWIVKWLFITIYIFYMFIQHIYSIIKYYISIHCTNICIVSKLLGISEGEIKKNIIYTCFK